MGWESVTQNTEVRGNTRHEPPPLGECAIVLGRYAVLCSTAPPPLRLSALQNACVCPHSGRHMVSYCFINDVSKTSFFQCFWRYPDLQVPSCALDLAGAKFKINLFLSEKIVLSTKNETFIEFLPCLR